MMRVRRVQVLLLSPPPAAGCGTCGAASGNLPAHAPPPSALAARTCTVRAPARAPTGGQGFEPRGGGGVRTLRRRAQARKAGGAALLRFRCIVVQLNCVRRALSSMNRDGDGVPRTQQRRPRRSYEQALPTAVQRTRGCSVEHPVSVDARHLEPGTGGATGSLAPRVAVLSPGWRGKGKGCKIRGYFRIISAAQS